MLNGWIRPKEWMAIWLDVGRSGFEGGAGCLRFLYKYGRRRAVIIIIQFLSINMALIELISPLLFFSSNDLFGFFLSFCSLITGWKDRLFGEKVWRWMRSVGKDVECGSSFLFTSPFPCLLLLKLRAFEYNDFANVTTIVWLHPLPE